MTKMWYEEVKKYIFDFDSNDRTEDEDNFKRGTGHFTQLVWASSKRIGCGIGVADSDKKFFGVANYDPAGNYLGDFDNNVFPASN